MLKGNEAIALGATHAGVGFYAGYPISPATTILLWMERNLVGEGKFAYQVSSEIESITAIMGAGYAGKKSMTATAGPGISLMSEGLGLAWMAEIPLVVVDVQRGGPATGLPTKTEQSDLMACMYPAHGDVLMPHHSARIGGRVLLCYRARLQLVGAVPGPGYPDERDVHGGTGAEHSAPRPVQSAGGGIASPTTVPTATIGTRVTNSRRCPCRAAPEPTWPTAASTTKWVTPPTCPAVTSR